MGNSKCRDDQNNGLQPAQWNYQAKQKQKMINPAENMQEPQIHKPQRRLEPSRIKPYQPRVTSELKGPNHATGGKESDHGHHAQSQPLERRMN